MGEKIMINWELKTCEINELVSYEKNPRILGEKEHRQLSDSIDRFGLVDKPVINLDNVIIGGHQRLEVLKGKGATLVECWVPDHLLDEKEVEELNIRLNRGGEFDYDILGNLFDIGDLLSWGFDEEELGLGKAEKKKKKEKFVVSFEFSDKDTMLEHLQSCEEIAQSSCAKMKIRG